MGFQWDCRDLLQRRQYPFLSRRALHAASQTLSGSDATPMPDADGHANAWQALHALHAVYEVCPFLISSQTLSLANYHSFSEMMITTGLRRLRWKRLATALVSDHLKTPDTCQKLTSPLGHCQACAAGLQAASAALEIPA